MILFNLSKLIVFSLFTKLKYNYTKKLYNIALNIIKYYINNSGCICIKCIQWLIPILEKDNINKALLSTLNSVYEDNKVHDINYTEYLYNKHLQ